MLLYIEAAERQKEIAKLQEINTSLMLQIRERDEQLEESKKSLKGKYYRIGIIIWSEYMLTEVR